MTFLPFDYLLIEHQAFDFESLKSTFSFFSERGVRKFMFLLNFDRSRHTVSWIKERHHLLKDALRISCPKGLIVRSYLNFELSDGIVYDPTLDRLLTNDSSALFVKLPLFSDESWIDTDLNYLLYKKKLHPILSSFQQNIHTNAQARVHQILQSNAYSVSLDLNYITAIDSRSYLEQIISREISVFPCISHSVSNYVGVLEAFESLKSRMGASSYTALTRNFLTAQKQLQPQNHYCTK